MSFVRRGFGQLPTLEELGAEVAGEAAIVQANLDEHRETVSNPHEVTTPQVGIQYDEDTQEYVIPA